MYTFIRRVFVLTWLFASAGASASESIVLGDSDAQLIGNYFEYLEDESGQLSIANIADGGRVFTPNQSDIISFGSSHSAFWLRFSIRNETTEYQSRIIEFDDPLIDKLELYAPVRDGFEVTYAGRLAAVSGDSIFHAFPALVINVRPERTETFYVRVESSATLIFTTRLLDLISFSERQIFVFVILGLYFGALLAVVLYEAVVYLTIRSKTRGHYLAYLMSFTIFQAMLILPNSEFSWAGEFWWPSQVLLLLAGLCLLLSVQFARSALDSPVNAPTSDVGLKLLMVLSLVIIAGSFTLSRIPFYLTHLAAVIGPVWIMGTVLVCLSHGVRAARFMIVAWPICLLGIVLFGLSNLGFLPRNLLTEHAMKIGFMVSAILFSAALADEANRKRKRDQQELETQISLRTSDLQARTNELENALENIQTLKGMIPICASCKNVRDDEGFWTQVESYIRDRSDVEFSHGICPECLVKLYGEDAAKISVPREAPYLSRSEPS